MNFIGVDLHKKSITICVMDEKQPIAVPEESEINHGIHRNTRKRGDSSNVTGRSGGRSTQSGLKSSRSPSWWPTRSH